MNKKRSIILITLLLTTGISHASDLNDGIAIDDNIDDSLQRDFNTSFVVTKSTTRAIAREKKGKDSNTVILKDGAGVGNIDIGAGSNLKGATIINLSTNKNSTAIAE